MPLVRNFTTRIPIIIIVVIIIHINTDFQYNILYDIGTYYYVIVVNNTKIKLINIMQIMCFKMLFSGLFFTYYMIKKDVCLRIIK